MIYSLGLLRIAALGSISALLGRILALALLGRIRALVVVFLAGHVDCFVVFLFFSGIEIEIALRRRRWKKLKKKKKERRGKNQSDSESVCDWEGGNEKKMERELRAMRKIRGGKVKRLQQMGIKISGFRSI